MWCSLQGLASSVSLPSNPSRDVLLWLIANLKYGYPGLAVHGATKGRQWELYQRAYARRKIQKLNRSQESKGQRSGFGDGDRSLNRMQNRNGEVDDFRDMRQTIHQAVYPPVSWLLRSRPFAKSRTEKYSGVIGHGGLDKESD